MTENYRRTDRSYKASKDDRETYIVETKYPLAGEHIHSRQTRFFYPDSRNPDGSIHRFPVPESITRRIKDLISKRRLVTGKNIQDTLSLLGILVGAFLLSQDMTGYVIGNLSRSDVNLAGAFAIIIGIIGLLISRKR